MQLATSPGLLLPARRRLDMGVKAPNTPSYRKPDSLPLSRNRTQQSSACLLRVASEQATAVETTALDNLYNEQMAKQMHWSNPFEYHFDRGLYFHEVSPNLFCGTQPRNPEEVRALADLHGIRTIVNLQQDGDMQYWGIDFGANERACHEHGVRLMRTPVRIAIYPLMDHTWPKLLLKLWCLIRRLETLIRIACATCCPRQSERWWRAWTGVTGEQVYHE